MVQTGRLGSPTRRLVGEPVIQEPTLTQEDFFREAEQERQARSQQQLNRLNEIINSRRQAFQEAQSNFNSLANQPLPDDGQARVSLQQQVNQSRARLDDLRIQTEQAVDQLEQAKRFATGEFEQSQVVGLATDRFSQQQERQKAREDVRKSLKKDLTTKLGQELGSKRARQIISKGTITDSELRILSQETLNKIGIKSSPKILKEGMNAFQQGDDEKPLIVKVRTIKGKELTEAGARKIRFVGGKPQFLTRTEFDKIPKSSFTEQDKEFNQFQETNVFFSPEREKFIESQSSRAIIIGEKNQTTTPFIQPFPFEKSEFQRKKGEKSFFGQAVEGAKSFFGQAVEGAKRKAFPEEFERRERELQLIDKANKLFPDLNKRVDNFNLRFGNRSLTDSEFVQAQTQELRLQQDIQNAEGIQGELKSIEQQRASEDKPFIVEFLNKPFIPVRDELFNFNKTFSLSDIASGILEVPERIGKKVSESEISRTIFLEGLGLRGRLKPEVEKKLVEKGTTIMGDVALFSLATPISLPALAVSGTSKTFDPTKTLEERFGGLIELGGVGAVVGVRGVQKTRRFLDEPVEIRIERTKPTFASNDLIVSFQTEEGFKDLAKFELIGFKSPTKVITISREQELLNFVTGKELFKDILEVDKGFTSLSKSSAFVVKDGVIQDTARVFTLKKGERFSPLLISELEGGIKPTGFSARNIKQLPTDIQLALQRIAESKAGRPVSIDNVSKILGREATIDLGGVVGTAQFKLLKSGVVKIIPRGKRITRGDLLSFAQEIDLPKEDFFLNLVEREGIKFGKKIPKENIDVFETFTSFREVTKPRLRAKSQQFSDIKGITLRLEIPSLEEGSVNVQRTITKTRQIPRQTIEKLGELKAVALKSLETRPLTLKHARAKVIKTKGLEQKTTSVFPTSALSQIGSLEPQVRQSSSVKEQVKVREGTQSKFINLSLERNLNKELTRSISKELSKSLSKELTRELVRETTKQISKQTTKELTKQTTKVVPKLSTSIFPRLPPIKPRGKITPRVRGGLKGLDLPKESLVGFNVEVRRRKKFNTIATDLPEGLAKKIGVETTLRNLGATFRLVKTGKKARRQDIGFKIPKDLFTTPALTSELNKPLTFIQRKKTLSVRGGRLLTRGERAEIQRSRRKR